LNVKKIVVWRTGRALGVIPQRWIIDIYVEDKREAIKIISDTKPEIITDSVEGEQTK